MKVTSANMSAARFRHLLAAMVASPTKTPVVSGSAFDVVRGGLRGVEPYEQLRSGQLNRAGYCELIDDGTLGWHEYGLTEDQLNFSARHPLDEELFVDETLRMLCGAGVIDAAEYPRRQFERLRIEAREGFEHGGRVTYIYPEEERLLFALSWISAPLAAVALGAFYGYATLWLLPGIAAAGGRMRLIDVDQETLALADRNLSALGFGDIVDFEVCDAAQRSWAGPIDLCFLDAEGPPEGVPEDLREKAVYGPILERVAPAIRPGGLLVAHNVLDDDLPRTQYLATRFATYGEQQRRFAAAIERNFDRKCVLATTEGVGAYRRRPEGGAG